jgi:hypothetical protein
MTLHIYRLNAPAAAAEEVDGEVIAINLSTGAYYSLVGWSAWVWQCLVEGASTDRIGSELERASGSAPTVELEDFVEQLLAERLIVDATEANTDATVTLPDPPALEFRELTFERHTDMADLILLDPVHDVEASEGWPKAIEAAE